MGDFEEILKYHSEEIVDLGRDLDLELGDNPKITPEFKPRISYNLLSFGNDPDVCFTSSKFTKEDFHLYFEKMKEVSQTSLGDLMSGDTDLDFKVYSGVNTQLKKLYFGLIGARGYVEAIPSFGRIGLYNSEDGTGKAPRIFFAVGHQATLHILACDPEHKIYSAK